MNSYGSNNPLDYSNQYCPNLENYEHDCSYPFSELVRVRTELGKVEQVLQERKMELRQAQDKILRQDVQLEEAAEIMTMQQKALKTSEEERKRIREDMKSENESRQVAEDKVKLLESSVKYISGEMSRMLGILSEGNIKPRWDVATSSGEWLQHKMKSLVRDMDEQIKLRMDEQKEMQEEIEKLKREMEEIKNMTGDEGIRRGFEVEKEEKEVIQMAKAEKKEEVKRARKEDNEKKVKRVKIEKTEDTKVFDKVDKKEEVENEDKMVATSSGASSGLKKGDVNGLETRKLKWTPCSTCGEKFLGNFALFQHTKKEHGKVEKKKKEIKFGCKECGFTFVSKRQLQVHNIVCCKHAEPLVKAGLIECKLGEANSSDEENMEVISELRNKSVFVLLHS